MPALSQDRDLTKLPPIPQDYQPAKTSWGEPDFRGGWPIDHLNSRTPLQRAEEHGNRAFLTEEEIRTLVQWIDLGASYDAPAVVTPPGGAP